MRNPVTSVEFLDLVRKSGLIRTEELDRLLNSDLKSSTEPVQSAGILMKAGLLTKFQAKLLLAGRYRGFKMGPYTVKDQIGQGGMGAVYLAEHETLRRRVALKVLAPGALGDKLTIERFLREARAAAALDHPNIVRIHDVGQQSGTHFLVMEYVTGQTLESMVLAGGPMACGRAVEYISQAAAGLQHAYEKGFIHRDIKPANLMVTTDGTVKLLDMGLARSHEQTDKLTELLDKGAVVGTADFIAPEQAINSPNVDIRADIYSLGATFFTLVTGHPPFAGSTTQKLMQHQMKTPTSISTIDKTFPPGLSAVVAKMLAKKPVDRYSSPEEVIAALAPWLPDSAAMRVVAGISSTEMGRTDRVKEGRSTGSLMQSTRVIANLANAGAGRKRGLLAVAVVVGILVIGGGAGALALALSSDKPPKENPPFAGPAVPDRSNEKDKTPPDPKIEVPISITPKPPTIDAGSPVSVKRGEVGLQVYRLSADAIDPFLQSFVESRSVNNFRPKLPLGVATECWKKETEGEFRSELLDGVRVVALMNRAGPPSAQVSIALEGDAGVVLEAGRDYTIRVVHQSQSDATGQLNVQEPGYKVVASKGLPKANGTWQTSELRVRRNPDLPLRLTIGANAVGPTSAIFIRSVEVFDANVATAIRTTGTVQYKLDLGTQKSFAEVGNSTVGSDMELAWVATERTGDGHLPAEWIGLPYNAATKAEYAARAFDGAMAIGMRLLSGQSTAMLLSPKVNTPGGRCRLAFDYKSDALGGDVVLRFKPIAPTPGRAYDIRIQTGVNDWATVVLDVELNGATAGVFEFHTRKADRNKWIWIRSFSVAELAPIRATGQPLYTADFSALTSASRTIVPMEKSASFADIDGQKLPPTITIAHFRNTAGGTYSIADVLGAKALGIQQTAGTVGVQINCKCNERLTKLLPGESAIVRVTYSYEGKGLGYAGIQSGKPPYYKIAMAELRTTGKQWKTVEIPFTRPVEGETYDLILNTGMDRIVETHAEGTIWFKSIEVLPAEAANTATEPVLFRFTAAEVNPFRATKLGRTTTAGQIEPTPKGVSFSAWKPDTASEWASGPLDGIPAIGYANLSGPPSAQIAVELENANGINAKLVPGKRYRLRVTYTTTGKAHGTAYFQDGKDYKVLQNLALPNSNADWRVVETIVERKDLPLRFVVDVLATGSANVLYVREIAVTEVIALPPTAPANPKKPDGSKLFMLAFTGLVPFKETMVNKAFATVPPLPKGFAAQCWKAASVAEFRGGDIDGSPAIGITNLNDSTSAQFATNLEKDLGVKLEVGKSYRVRIEYLTRNDASGRLYAWGEVGQILASANLPNAPAIWKSADVTFTRTASPVSIAFENSTVGEGNTLYVRSLEVFAIE